MIEAFEVKAVARHIGISPQKVRLVIDTVRGKDAEEALEILRFMPNRAAEPVFKLVQSAIANAEENFGLEADDLFISRIYADEGPRNRLRPYGGRFGARGRFKPIMRRTSHITVILAEREATEYLE
ncbi:MAG: 50S ribosomal protein L22 [Anaerolineales bacterium]|nr:50S ribosomal protein L22 [Anaerolineales bacterium]MCB8954211.1 50S ribosomal protein L22 [Ardenticatenales bacterium]